MSGPVAEQKKSPAPQKTPRPPRKSRRSEDAESRPEAPLDPPGEAQGADEEEQPSVLRSFALRAAERIGALTGEADEVIAEIRRDAEESASAEGSADDVEAAERARLLRELGDALADYAAGVRQQCEDVLAVLERVSVQLEPGPAGEPHPAGADGATEEAPARPPEEEAAPGREPRAGEQRASPGLRLLAMQMASAGTPRAEIAGRLREDFGYSNADELLDEIFAP
jgi:hypothetical protein